MHICYMSYLLIFIITYLLYSSYLLSNIFTSLIVSTWIMLRNIGVWNKTAGNSFCCHITSFCKCVLVLNKSAGTGSKRYTKANFKRGHKLAGPLDDFFDANDALESVFIQLWDRMLVVAPWPTGTSADRLLASERAASDNTFGFKSEPGTNTSHTYAHRDHPSTSSSSASSRFLTWPKYQGDY